MPASRIAVLKLLRIELHAHAHAHAQKINASTVEFLSQIALNSRRIVSNQPPKKWELPPCQNV